MIVLVILIVPYPLPYLACVRMCVRVRACVFVFFFYTSHPKTSCVESRSCGHLKNKVKGGKQKKETLLWHICNAFTRFLCSEFWVILRLKLEKKNARILDHDTQSAHKIEQRGPDNLLTFYNSLFVLNLRGFTASWLHPERYSSPGTSVK